MKVFIIYSSSCHSEPVWFNLFDGSQKEVIRIWNYMSMSILYDNYLSV